MDSEIAARCTDASNCIMGCCVTTVEAKAEIGFLGEAQSGIEQAPRNDGSADPSRGWELGLARAEEYWGR